MNRLVILLEKQERILQNEVSNNRMSEIIIIIKHLLTIKYILLETNNLQI